MAKFGSLVWGGDDAPRSVFLGLVESSADRSSFEKRRRCSCRGATILARLKFTVPDLQEFRMKSYLVAFLLAAGALLSAVLPAAADQDQMTWSSMTRSSPQSAAPAKAAPKATASKSAASKIAASKPVVISKPVRTATADDGSRPQRKAATKPTPARTAVTSNGGGGTLSGVASYYWQPQPVASGGRFNPDALTAAHKTLPFGTRVRVTHGGNGRSVEVVINDRGPYIAGRIIDLSRRAAQVIGMTDQGIARVNVAILGK
jgi:rare lipoprotein A